MCTTLKVDMHYFLHAKVNFALGNYKRAPAFRADMHYFLHAKVNFALGNYKRAPP